MRKMFTLLLALISLSAFATIPVGTYKVEKIQCKNSGEIFKLGGKYMIYDILLDVTHSDLKMYVNAKNNPQNLPLNINCTQENYGKIVYTKEHIFEGELKLTHASCNAATWTMYIKAKKHGVEEYGSFFYVLIGNRVIISKPDTKTKYGCNNPGDYPVLEYVKIK